MPTSRQQRADEWNPPAIGATGSLDVDQIDSSPFQARTTFDAETIDDLSRSIRQCGGLIHPLTVRAKEDGRYEVICGERRLRAARRLGLHQVPVVILEADDTRARVTALVENMQREDLNPLDKANGLVALREALGAASWVEVARHVGLTKGRISQILSVLTVPQQVIELIAAGRLSESQVRMLRALIDDEQELVRLAKLVAGQEARSTRGIKELVEQSRVERGISRSAGGGSRHRAVEEVRVAIHRAKKVFSRVLKRPLSEGQRGAVAEELSQLVTWCQRVIGNSVDGAGE